MKTRAAKAKEKAYRASLLSLPNEILLQLLDEPNSLQAEWKEKGLKADWYVWYTEESARLTTPWSQAHHPIAIRLSQTCRRLRDLILPIIWSEIGLNTLEDVSTARDILRLFPERAAFVRRLEWSWLRRHPAYEDEKWCLEHEELDYLSPVHQPLEVILKAPFRWPKQQLATRQECFDAITEVLLQLSNLDTLLWKSPYLGMEAEVVDFLASKPVPLRAFQANLAGFVGSRAWLQPGFARYWKFASKLEKLSFEFRPGREEVEWKESDLLRWSAYDDDLSGIEEHCRKQIKLDEEQGEVADWGDGPEAKLARYVFSEQQMAVAYKMLITACQGSLVSLDMDPPWVYSTPALAHHWVRLERFHRVRDCIKVDASSELEDTVEYGKVAHLGSETLDSYGCHWLSQKALWHSGAAAIRPAIYHLARHRKESGPLTGKDIQTLADRPPVYPASLFYPCFKTPSVAQRMADVWQELVEKGQTERVVCSCVECQGAP